MPKLLIILIFFISFNIHSIFAQSIFNHLDSDMDSVYTIFKFDPTFALSLGYIHSFPVDIIQRDISLGAEFTWPIFLNILKNYQLELSSRINLLEIDSWSIVNKLGVGTQASSNIIDLLRNKVKKSRFPQRE